MHLHKELEQRGLLYQFSHEKAFEIYQEWGKNFYCGFDPSADSLTIGNFVPIMHAVQYMKRWNKFFLLIGGATGMIGDPGGKDAERNFLDLETLKHNKKCITKQVKNLLKNLEKLSWFKLEFEVINNYDFYKEMNVLDFFRNIWKYITINKMITKETVKKRIEDPDKSISYTEFSYMLLQGNDYVHLFENKNIALQICGSDQRGNCITWLELIRKKLDKEAYVISNPLILDSTGKKFWKSEWNAIRLDPNKNSPYYAYQYFMNATDDDIERFLKLFTLLNFDQIDNIITQHLQAPEKRYGQTQLANYVIEIIFGKEASLQAQKISEILFGKENKIQLLKNMNQKEIKALCKETWDFQFNKSQLPIKILDLCTQTNITNSNWEAKKMIQAGSIYLNEEKITDIQQEISQEDTINQAILLRKWKKVFKTIYTRPL